MNLKREGSGVRCKEGRGVVHVIEIKSGACRGYWTWLRNVYLFSVAVLILCLDDLHSAELVRNNLTLR